LGGAGAKVGEEPGGGELHGGLGGGMGDYFEEGEPEEGGVVGGKGGLTVGCGLGGKYVPC